VGHRNRFYITGLKSRIIRPGGIGHYGVDFGAELRIPRSARTGLVDTSIRPLDATPAAFLLVGECRVYAMIHE